MRLHVSVTWRRGKFEASHQIPHYLYEAKRYTEPRLEIGIGFAKSPEQIAKDISRRIIPDAVAQLERIKAVHKEQTEYKEQKAKALDRIAAALGIEPSQWDRERDKVSRFESQKYRIEAKVGSSDSVELEIRYVTAEQAEQIVKLIRSF